MKWNELGISLIYWLTFKIVISRFGAKNPKGTESSEQVSSMISTAVTKR